MAVGIRFCVRTSLADRSEKAGKAGSTWNHTIITDVFLDGSP